MEWKEKSAETILVGALTLLGAWVIKKIKPLFNGLSDIATSPKKIKLFESEKDILHGKVNALVSISSDAIFICNEDGACVYANETLCELFGASESDMEGYGWSNFIKHDERERAKKEWKSGIENDKNITSGYTIVNGRTGQLIECTYTAIVHRVNGRIITILGVVKKVT